METAPLDIRLPCPPDFDATAQQQCAGGEQERATNPQRLHPDSTSLGQMMCPQTATYPWPIKRHEAAFLYLYHSVLSLL